jgi:hypothetical protein
MKASTLHNRFFRMHTKQRICCTSESFLFFFKRQVLPSCSVQGVCILANGGINHPMAVTHETNPLRNFLLIWVQSQRNFTFRHPVYSELHFTTLSMSATQNISLSTSVTRTMFQFSSPSSSHSKGHDMCQSSIAVLSVIELAAQDNAMGREGN